MKMLQKPIGLVKIVGLSLILLAIHNEFSKSNGFELETPKDWRSFEPIRAPIEMLTSSPNPLASYKLDAIGMRISIDNIPAPYFLAELRNQQYECMRLFHTDLNPLLEPNQFTDEEKIERAFKFQVKLINCTPFFNDLIERSLQNLGLIGRFIRVWIGAIDKYLKRTRISGYRALSDTLNVRYLHDLDEVLRETMKRPYQFDRTIFGSMAPEGELDEDMLQEYHIARAYYAGDGFCNHINSPPFTNISHLIKQTMVVGKLLIKQVHDPDGTKLLRFHPIRMHLMRTSQPELILIIESLQQVCTSLKENPAPRLMGYLKQLTPLLKHTPKSTIPVLLTTVNTNITEIVNDLTKQKRDEEEMQNSRERFNHEDDTCSWLTLFKLKKLAQASLSAEETAAFFLSRHRSLGANTFLEVCLNRLLNQYREKDSPNLWPEDYEDTIILEQIARRAEITPKVIGYGSRPLDLINTRDFSTLSEFDDIFLFHYGNYYNANFEANTKQIVSYATGAGSMCDFYTKLKIGKGDLFHMIELIYSVLDIVEFKLKFSNDATAFFHLWRFCSLNSLMPIHLDVAQAPVTVSH